PLLQGHERRQEPGVMERADEGEQQVGHRDEPEVLRREHPGEQQVGRDRDQLGGPEGEGDPRGAASGPPAERGGRSYLSGKGTARQRGGREHSPPGGVSRNSGAVDRWRHTRRRSWSKRRTQRRPRAGDQDVTIAGGASWPGSVPARPPPLAVERNNGRTRAASAAGSGSTGPVGPGGNEGPGRRPSTPFVVGTRRRCRGNRGVE